MNKTMKKKIMVLLLLTVSVLFVSCADSEVNNKESTEKDTSMEKEEMKIGIVEEVVVPAPSLANNIIEEDLENEIMVYLPSDYETSGLDYPVLYFLPGFGDNYKVYMNTFTVALNKEQIKSMIVVTVNGRNNLNGCFYANSPVMGNWEDFITKDLVNYMDNNYRTLSDPKHRGIAGHSMGGTGAINLSMNTNLFGHVYAMSPGLLAPDSFQETSVDFKLIEPIIKTYQELSNEEAKEKYLTAMKNMNWPVDFTFAYASAFAYDTEIKAPFIL